MLSRESEEDSSSALQVYYRRERKDQQSTLVSSSEVMTSSEPMRPMVSESNYVEREEIVRPQEVCARLAYNRPYVGHSVTDTIGNDGFYKHQVLVGRQMFQNDSCLVMHDPGTGKTITHLRVMMELLRARVITNFLIINLSPNPNAFALYELKKLFDRIYHRYFPMTFTVFKRIYVRTTTLSHIGDYPYKSNMGIVIDEAHNLFSDNNGGMKKIKNFDEFVKQISVHQGIKLLLLSATPLLGNTDSLGKFRSIMYRSQDEEHIQHIPPCLISYIQISYKHLDIEQVLNSEYTDRNGYNPGDRSFDLTNGVKYDFKFYLSKPKPMQTADFAKNALLPGTTSFQVHQKPIIVSSGPHKTRDPETGEMTGPEEEQSAIGEEIVKLIRQTDDGTIIIYCDLVAKGAEAMARFLDKHGFEDYTKRDSTQREGTGGSANSYNPIFQLKVKRADKFRELRSLEESISLATEDHLQELKDQREQLEEDKNGIYKDILDSFIEYNEDYETRFEKNSEMSSRIAKLEEEREELEKQINELRPNSNVNRTTKQRYLIYRSTMDVDSKHAFEIFNRPENWDGSVIKVIIGSRVMRDGVDIHHAVQTHITIPEWRIPGFIQAQHRGIRSSGHKYLMHHRAIKMVEKQKNDPTIPFDRKITYEQAYETIMKNKIKVQIYNHFVDMSLLEIEDIEEARPYLDDNVRQMSDEEILDLLKNGNNTHKAGEAIIQAAIRSYRPVGAEMMKLRAESLDYKLNVGREARVRDAMTDEEKREQNHIYAPDEFLAKKDIELFFMEDSVSMITKRIMDILFKVGYINTDELFRTLLKGDPKDVSADGSPIPPPTKQMIATSIVELTRFTRRVYHELFGVELYIKLYERSEMRKDRNGIDRSVTVESILYLCTTKNDMNVHPYIAVAYSNGFTTNRYMPRIVPKIQSDDLDLEKKSSTFSLLKSIIEKGMRGGSGGEESLNGNEVQFLVQMSNYWGFSWQDLAKPGAHSGNISVYVLEAHIVNPDIFTLAKSLTAYAFNLSSNKWQKTNIARLKNTILIRYASLVNMYKSFSFFKIDEFKHYLEGKETFVKDVSDINGIVLVKGYYDPIDEDKSVFRRGLDLHQGAVEYVKNVFERNIESLKSLESKFIVKQFLGLKSRGSKISSMKREENAPKPTKYDADTVRAIITEIMEKDISLPFFLYDKDTNTNNYTNPIIQIKRREMEVMQSAMQGNPTLRFQIYAVESRIADPTRKKEIYKQIYKPPEFLHK